MSEAAATVTVSIEAGMQRLVEALSISARQPAGDNIN